VSVTVLRRSHHVAARSRVRGLSTRHRIDTIPGSFLDFGSFGVREHGLRRAARALVFFLATGALASAGCGPRPTARGVEESLTSGRISIVVSAEIGDLIERERDAFVALYPQAEIRVERGTSSRALRDLFAARCDVAAITREVDPDERGAAVRGRLELEVYRFGRDAIVMIANPSNPVENMAIDGIRRIYEGDATNWRQFGGPDLPIEPVVPPMKAGVTETFVQKVLDGNPVRARAILAASDSEVVNEVARRPGALGFVTLPFASRAPHALRVASLSGLRYVGPDPEAVYDGSYPLARNLNLYLRTKGPQLAKGFVTFVTSRDGQVLVHEAGLVPTSVAVRFVRRSPMLGTH
jgi:phosphate transport system substrate-binding protein